MIDPKFKVTTLSATHNPQTLIWQAMHQDYSERCVSEEQKPDEREAGKIIVKRLLAGERGHYGPLEHPQISFSVGYFPHSVMQQARTHRVGISFDVQSMRYTGSRVVEAANGVLDIEKVFYLRPSGYYSDRNGKKYVYTEADRNTDIAHCLAGAQRYAQLIEQGKAEEQARGVIAFDFRQHFVVSFTLRALLHFLDLRYKLDAQEEIRHLCALMWLRLEEWAPEIADWYFKSRIHKARLSP